MATINSYTNIEQSRKLAEILPLESADMTYRPIMDIDSMSNSGFLNIPDCYPFNEFKDCYTKPLPCWSLSALLSILKERDDCNALEMLTNKAQLYTITTSYYKDASWKNISTMSNNIVDACVDTIIKLNELNLL